MKTVFVLDDTESELELISTYLRESGFTVVSHSDAPSALEKIKSIKPDVVVTDIVMPGKSGYELCRSMKKEQDIADIPVIACTSKDQDIDRLWALKQGVSTYITKPFTRDDIVQAVQQALAIN